MPKAKENDNVKVHFTCATNDGTIIGSTMNDAPLQFTLGQKQVLPGVEESVIGMEAGEEKNVTLPPEKTFGPHREDLIRTVDRNSFSSDQKIEAGMSIQTKGKNGETVVYRVIESNEKTVTLDLNHPLADKDLTFQINLVEIT
jgi:peptidylprolyl isomerase